MDQLLILLASVGSPGDADQLLIVLASIESLGDLDQLLILLASVGSLGDLDQLLILLASVGSLGGLDQQDLTRFNKICHPCQRPRWQVDKEAIGLSRVQQCSSTYNPPS